MGRGKRRRIITATPAPTALTDSSNRVLLALAEAGGYPDGAILAQYDLLYKRLEADEITRELISLEQRGYLCRGKHNRLRLTALGEMARQEATQNVIDLTPKQVSEITRPIRGHDVHIVTMSDIPALVDLKQEVTGKVYRGLGETELADWTGRFADSAYFQERIGPDALFLIVGDKTHPHAMAALKRRDGKAYFGDLYCRRQGEGLGSGLANRCDELARFWKLGEGICDVFSTNEKALRFIDHLGWKHASEYEEQSFHVTVFRFSKSI